MNFYHGSAATLFAWLAAEELRPDFDSPNPIFVALDTPDLQRALTLSRAVKDHVGGLKVGLEFYTACGPDGVRRIVELGLPSLSM
jgi:orotidine-5'-phosphate decarboxylase